LIMATVGAVAVGGVAYATHVPEVDPLTVPPGFLTAHNRVADVPVSAFARATAAKGTEVTVQHIRLTPNQAIPWHTHPGPVYVLVERGGFGHVHQAFAGVAGAEIYAVYVFPPGTANHLIPTAPAKACT
jgi:hypothetical protein